MWCRMWSRIGSNANYLNMPAVGGYLKYFCPQVKKLQDRVDKSQKDVENTKDKYEEALAVLHKYNSTYVDDMTEVFGKTQDFEEKRLRFFKDILIAVHGCLDISRSNE